MPVDRRHRDELADTLAKFLRDEAEIKEFDDAIAAILRNAPQRSHEERHGEGSGFPLVPLTVAEPLDDLVLDFQVAKAVHESFTLLYSTGKTRNIEEGRNILIRTLSLLRSNLEEHDLALPRNETIAKHAGLKLGCLSLATLMTALLALAFLESPYPLLCWPIIGVFLAFKKDFLVHGSPIRDEPDSFPFHTAAQRDSAASLVPPDEIRTFAQTFKLPEAKKEKSWPIWKYICVSPLVPVIYIFTIGTMLIFVALYLAIWPFFLYDRVRTARRPLWK